MKKMKIEKYKQYTETHEGDGGDDYSVESDYTVSSIQDRIFIRTLDKNTYLVITIEPEDILKQMTWLVGQEEHKRREKIHEEKQFIKEPPNSTTDSPGSIETSCGDHRYWWNRTKKVWELLDGRDIAQLMDMPQSLMTDKDSKNQKKIFSEPQPPYTKEEYKKFQEIAYPNTTKDKIEENQKKLDSIRDTMVDHECNNITLVQFWDKLTEILDIESKRREHRMA